MSDPRPPVPAGPVGIMQLHGEHTNPLATPLSPLEMWRQAVQSGRGFESTPSGTADTLRQQPSTIPGSATAGDKGVRVGKGYETFAAIQLLDKDGRRVDFGADHFGGGGLDDHAEARI